MSHKIAMSLAIAAALGSALATAAVSTPAQAGPKEKCYGVSLKGQNDCAAGSHSCAGSSTVDYDGQSFKLVPKGTCGSTTTPKGMGSLKPMKG